MKERKGTQGIKKAKVSISVEHHAELLAYCRSKNNRKMKDVIELFIREGIKHDIYEENWFENIKVMKERMNACSFLDGGCPGLAYGEDKPQGEEKRGKGHYFCVWYQNGKPPQIRKLGSTESLADTKCKACNKTGEIWKGIASYETELKDLRARAKQGVQVAVPKCGIGSVLSEDGLSFYCKRQTIDIKIGKCKTLRKGANCKDLGWSYMTLEGTLPEKKL